MQRKIFLSILSAVLFITACKMYYPVQEVAFPVKSSAEKIARGKHMSTLMCNPCHYDPATKKLSGIHMADVAKFVGKVYGKNLTQHPEKGITHYSDGELAYLLRTGLAKDGKLMPYMQRPNLSDEDLEAIIAFLRSDDELVKPSEQEPPETKYTLVGKFGLSKFSPRLPYPRSKIAAPAADPVAQGKYLVDNLSCYDCHSKSFQSLDKMKPENSKGYMAGGMKMKDAAGNTIYSPNLTFHETGLGGWTEQDLIKALKTNISKDNSIITYPMPSFTELSETEIRAIYAYLKTLPPVDNKVKR